MSVSLTQKMSPFQYSPLDRDCEPCTLVANAAPHATYLCTDAGDSEPSECDEGYIKQAPEPEGSYGPCEYSNGCLPSIFSQPGR